MPLPRLLPRPALRARPLPIAFPSPSPFTTTALRRAAARKPPASKNPVLEKPDAFRPPSHGARLPRQRPAGARYGPAQTAEDAARQRAKQYPNMMPPEGTFLHWFLTDRSIHVWISMTVLATLTLAMIHHRLATFHRTDPLAHAHDLPPPAHLVTRPFTAWPQYLRMYRLTTERRSQELAEQRRQRQEDAERRRAYRKAHGEEEGFEVLGIRFGMEEEAEEAVPAGAAVVGDGQIPAAVDGDIDGEVKRKKPKKWFGIWE